jgi:hypothetical protein
MKIKIMNLIEEARKRGYRKGTPIRYCNHIIDYVEGDYFEIDSKGNLLAYKKPKSERKCFEDFTHDTLYCSESKEWVEIAM